MNMRKYDAAVIDTGRDFVRMKDQLGHGHFIRWLSAEFDHRKNGAEVHGGGHRV
jgi:hypothetical protein